MKMPDTKFDYGDIVVIHRDVTDTIYEDCEDCYGGSLTVVGPKGTTKVTCKKCNGSGHSYKIVSRTHRDEIVGLLEIDGVWGEFYQNPDETWHRSGYRYRGKAVWKSDYDPGGWNIFSEEKLEKI